MRYQFFTIAIHGGEAEAEALNRFLGGHRIVEIDRQFLPDGANSAWCFCVGFSEAGERPPSSRQARIDYKEVLNDVDFARFARLRQLRKEFSEREGIPAYAIFTNDQLAEIVRRSTTTAAGLREIPGVGAARVEKYGEAFVKCLGEMGAGDKAGKPEAPA